ncbi:hypothetical protein ICN29_03505 [Polynucleobacter sp. AP-Mumm-500A-B3]|nr:hypothetical protein [Polynucleobacter nymphae]
MTKLSERLELNRSMQPPSKADPTSRDIEEFEDLYKFLAPKNDWSEADYGAWCVDLAEDKKLTIGCLRALQNAYEAGRAMTNDDWSN